MSPVKWPTSVGFNGEKILFCLSAFPNERVKTKLLGEELYTFQFVPQRNSRWIPPHYDGKLPTGHRAAVSSTGRDHRHVMGDVMGDVATMLRYSTFEARRLNLMPVRERFRECTERWGY